MRPRPRRNFLKRQHKRSYRAKQFRNPYFKTKPKRFGWWKHALAVLVIIGAVVGILYGLSSISWLKITDVTVNDLPTIQESEIIETAWEQIHKRRLFVFPQDSRVFLDEDALYERIWDNFSLSELSIERDGHTLNISATERLTSLVWLSEEHWGLLDLDGSVIRDLTDEEMLYLTFRSETGEGTLESASIDPQVPVVLNLSGAEFSEGQGTVAGEMIENVIAFDEAVRTIGLTPIVYEIESDDTNWLRLNTENFDVLFDAEGDVDEQVEGLSVIMKEYEDLEALEYIDVRFGNHVYLK